MNDQDTVHGRILAVAAARPSAVAVRQRDEVLTFEELVLAARLVGAQLTDAGVRPGDLVLVRGERRPALVAALLGVLLAGGVYVAADGRWPPVTLRRIADQARLVVDVGRPAIPLPGPSMALDPGARALVQRARTAATDRAEGPGPGRSWPPVEGTDPCCVFYTSGTTGEAKGVLALHRGTVGRFCDVDYAPFDEETVTLQAAPLPWDGLTLELWSSVLNGGTVVLHDGPTIDPPALRAARASGVNTLWLTSPLFAGLVEDDIDCFAGYRLVMTGGDRTSAEHVRRFLRRHPAVILLHGYGPAEATVFATAYTATSADMDGRDDVPLGHPLPHTTVWLLDDDLRAVADGATGEICVGGVGVAAGYLGDEDLTATRFVRRAGERLYRTGDQGWRDTDGQLHFVGRRDRQVKVRGNRLELGEVEAAVRAVPEVVEAHATVVGDVGRERLALHYTTHDLLARGDVVSKACDEALPAYAVPSRIVHHPRLPLTARGKVDVDALRRVDAEGARSEDHQTGVLQDLVAVVLGRRPAAEEDLVDAGLDSLSAMRVAYRTSVAFGVEVGVEHLYAVRRIDRLASLLPGLPPLADDDGARRAGRTMLPGELDWWLREQLLPGDPAALVVSVFDIHGGAVDPGLLRVAVGLLADRHDILRSRVEVEDGVPRLTVLERGTVAPVCFSAPSAAPVVGSSLDGALPAEATAPFDLEREPAWRVCLVDRGAAGATLVVVAHHRLVDGWSDSVLVGGLGETYRQARDLDEPGPVGTGRPPGPRRVFERTAGADGPGWWASQLRTAVPLDLVPREAADLSDGLQGRWDLALEETADAFGACPGASGDLVHRPASELLQARLVGCLAHALRTGPGPDPVCVAVAYAGRDRVSEDELGCFVEVLPLAVPLEGGPVASSEAAARLWLGALEHRGGSLSAKLAGVRRDRGDVVQVVFAVQSNVVPSLDLGGELRAVRRDVVPVVPLHPVDVEVYLESRPRIRFTWDRRIVDSGWATRVCERLVELLPQVGLKGVVT